MKRLMILLMVVLAVGVMASVTIAQPESGSIDIRLDQPADDNEEFICDGSYRSNAMTSSDIELGYDHENPAGCGAAQLVGLRFRNVQIPKGSKITSATVQFSVDENDTLGACSVIVYAELNANAAPFQTATTYDISSRTPTSAASDVFWTVPDWPTTHIEGPDQETPDISAVLNEVIKLPGWAPGNAIVVIVIPDPAFPEIGHRAAEAVDGNIAEAARLRLEYELDNKATLVSPPDGSHPLVTLTTLEWERPDPNGPGTLPTQLPEPFNVNVIFGTDPDLDPVDDIGASEIVTNEDTDTTSNFTLAPNTAYYWRVNLIDPNEGAGNQPVIIEGPIWTFSTTVLPAVIVTPTAITVSEEGPTSDIYNVSLSKAPASPVTVTPGPALVSPLELHIMASGDDAEENQSSGDIGRSSSDLEMPYDGTTYNITGLWFDNVLIPMGATITSARVDFVCDINESGDVYLTIGGRLDDTGSFQQDTNWMISTPTITDDETIAEVEWTPPAWTDDVVYSTPDLTTIIQEIVNGSAWSLGRGLTLAIRNGNSGGTTASGIRRRAESFNGVAGMEPVLHIAWTVGTGTLGLPISWSPPSVTLDGTNWSTGLDVTVTAVDDLDFEFEVGSHEYILENTVTSADVNWDGLPADSVTVTILENDCGAWGYALYDVNENCWIDLPDIAEFMAMWMTCSRPNDSSGFCVDYR